MAQPLDYVDYLSREIGARPAGTEEEQQAALYIADEFQKEAGFSAAIEEFTSSSNLEGYRAILAMITIVVSILAMLFNILTGPAFVLATAAAVIYALEAFGRPIISKPLSRGASQNVVAKYQPHGNQGEGRRGMRTRKIVLLAHYDTNKVTPKVIKAAEKTGLPLGMICLGGMVAAAFFLLLRVFVGGTGGAGLVIINILTIIAIIIVALPVVKAILYRVAPYNEGANNNATGVAALLEIARRINQGSVSEADLADAEGVVIHGEQAALESGLVPDGTLLSYEVESNAYEVDEDASEEDRLLAAKAAIAAMTGQYVEQRVYATASETAQMRAIQQGTPAADVAGDEPFAEGAAEFDMAAFDDIAADAASAGDAASASGVVVDAPLSAAELSQNVAAELQRLAEPASPDETGGFQNAPSWFVSAQRNAKRSESPEPIQRSRYTEAITAAEQELADRERAKAEEERVRLNTELREAARAAASSVGLANAGLAAEEESATTAANEPAVEAPEQPSIEFAPIDLDGFYNQAPIVELEPIDVSDQNAAATVVPAQPGSASEQFADPSQTVAYIPDHLRAILHKRSAGNEADVDASIEANGAAAVVSSLAQDELVYDEEAEMAFVDAKIFSADEDEVFAAENADAQERLAGLPTIEDAEEKTQVAENTNPSRSGLFRMLRSDVPSLSGAFTPVEEPAPAKAKPRLTKADLPSLSGIIDPVGVEPQQDASPRRRPSLDGLDVPAISSSAATVAAEAVDYEMQLPVSDELAQAAEAALEPQEDQPASLDQLAQIASEERADLELNDIALDGVDEPAEQDDQASWDNPIDWDDQAEWDDQVPIAPKPLQVEMPASRADGFLDRFRRKEENLTETPQEWLDVDDDFEAREVGRERGGWESFRTGADDQYDDRSWEGGAFSRVRLGHVNMRSEAEEEANEADSSVEAADDQALNEEIEQIYHFRNPAYESDIWFVAIGSETELHDGARAFIEAHKSELRGAMFVEIESLGLGELCYATEEGQFRRFKSSSRIKRFTRDASAATGISLGQISTSTDSITTTIQKEGFQAMHLMGVEDGLPALKGSADDIVENVDELIFEENINYLMELMKQK